MLTVFDEIKDDFKGIVNFAYASSISFGREVLQKVFEKCDDEVFKQYATKCYNQAVSSDLFKHNLKKQIKEALLKEVKEEK